MKIDSVYAASLAAVSRVEQALSEAASSLSSFTPRPGPQRPWMIQIKVRVFFIIFGVIIYFFYLLTDLVAIGRCVYAH